MANRYTFPTTLQGFIKIDEDGGKYNNRTFEFQIPDKHLEKIEADRNELIDWIKSKDSKRLATGLPVWNEDGSMKYTYGAGDGSRKAKPEPVFVDADGVPCSKETLKAVRKGTKVNVILQQKPYAMGTFNTSVRVIGVQIVELVTGSGAVDSGDLSVDDVAAMFGSVDGFKQGEPAVRQEASTEPTEAASEYDF